MHVHWLMAAHQKCWKPLAEWCQTTASLCVNSVIEKWDSVELFNNYRFFYETIVVAAVEYLASVVPKDICAIRRNYSNNSLLPRVPRRSSYSFTISRCRGT